MTDILHMETDEVREVINRLARLTRTMDSDGGNLNRAMNHLSFSWQGSRATTYRHELRSWLWQFNVQVDKLDYLILQASHEIDEWEQADVFKSFDWGKPINKSIKLAIKQGAKEIAKRGSKMLFDTMKDPNSWETYKGIGRNLNKLIDNQKGGFVGLANKVGHFIRSPIGNFSLNHGVPVVVDTVFSAGEEGLPQAFVSAAVSQGIKSGLKYLIPGFGTVMLVSSVVQVAGNLLAGGLDLLGYHKAAVGLQNTLDVIDLGGYVDDLADGIADAVLPPYNRPPDFSKLTDRCEKLGNAVGSVL